MANLAIETRREIYGGDKHREVAESIICSSPLYLATGQFNKCMEKAEEAKKIFAEMNGEKHYDYASCCNLMGMFYGILQNSQKCDELYQKAVELRTEMYGENHFRIGDQYEDWGNSYLQIQNVPKALEVFQKLIDFKLKNRVDGDDLKIASAHLKLAQCLLTDQNARNDEYVKGLTAFGKAIEQDAMTAFESDAFMGVFVTSMLLPGIKELVQEHSKIFESWTAEINSDPTFYELFTNRFKLIAGQLGKSDEEIKALFNLFKLIQEEPQNED